MARANTMHPTWMPFVAGVTLAGFMAMVPNWGCNRFEDTFINFSTASGVGGGGGGVGQGGSGGSTPQSAKDFFEQEVKPLLLESCAGSDCHSSGSKAFLLTGNEYASIITYKTALGIPLLVDPPELSPLLTHPDSGDHSGPSFLNLQTVRAAILTWLKKEADNLEPIKILQVGPIVPQGLTVVPLDSIGPEFAGSRISFYASEFGEPATVLELTDIALWPPNGLGVRATNPTFFVLPKDGPAEANVGFHGDPHEFVAPNNVSLGSGDLVLPNWTPDAQLAITFEELEILFADSDGNTYDLCTDDDLFEEAVKGLPINDSINLPNGLLYCAEQCHGGDKGTQPTAKFNLSGLLAPAPNYRFMCAKTRPFIVSGNVDESAIITLTEPPGGGAHPFAFGGNAGAHGVYKAAMTAWISAEGAEDEE